MDYRRNYSLNFLNTHNLYFHRADHWQDVIAGSILGLVSAYFAFRLYYPSLRSPYVQYPLSMQDRVCEEPALPLTMQGEGLRIPSLQRGHKFQPSAELLRVSYRDEADEGVPSGEVIGGGLNLIRPPRVPDKDEIRI